MEDPEVSAVYQPPPNGFRTFIIVWITQSISVIGSALTLFSINIWLTQTLYARPEQKPELAAALSAVNLAYAIPLVVGAPLAGGWVDRHDRKRTMMVADFMSGGLSVLLMLLILSGYLQLWMLILLTVSFSLSTAYHAAGFDTSYAMIVPAKQLPRANGMMQSMWALSGIVAPLLAAAIIALPGMLQNSSNLGVLGTWIAGLPSGVPLAIGIDAITFWIAAVTLIFLYIPSPMRTELGGGSKSKPSLRQDVLIGALYILDRQPLLWLLITFAVANFAGGGMGIFEPLLVKFNLAESWQELGYQFESALALIVTISGLGGLVGAVLISLWGGLKKRRVYGVLLPLIVVGVGLILVGQSNRLYLSAALFFISTAMVPIMNAHSQTIWQTQVPHELQGRVFSVRRLIAQFTWPLSAAIAGWAGGRFDPGMVMSVMGILLTVFTVLQLFNPYLLKVEDKAYLDDLAARRQVQAAE